MLNTDILKQVDKVLDSFAKSVIKDAKGNLSSTNKNASGTLSKSLKSRVKDGKLEILMEEYGAYVDQGVSGLKKKYNTRFQYKTMPNITAMAAYAKSKNMKLRDSKGRFKKGGYKTIGFLIARKLLNEGLKPSHFISKPFDSRIKTLAKEIINNIKL